MKRNGCFPALIAALLAMPALAPALFAQQIQDPPELVSQAAVLLDAATGTMLYAKGGDAEIPPASLTKLMTIHLVLEEVAAGRASLEEIVDLPREAWASSQPPRSSLMHLAPGQRVSLRELILGLAIPSGNDAAVAVALRFAPTVAAFAEQMNREAQRLGLVNTRFVEPSGISEDNMTTAREFALFCREYLRLHPETLGEFHSVREFAYPKAENVAAAYRDRPGTERQLNHNALLGRVEGVDGLKTGYIDEAGYNIALTAERRGTRLVAVILGAPAAWGGDRIRDADGEKLLTWGFDTYRTLRTDFPAPAPVRVWKGKTNQVTLLPAEGERNGNADGPYDLTFTTLTARGHTLRWETEWVEPLIAPLPAGTEAGALVLYDASGELRRIPLLTAEPVEAGNFFMRLRDSARLFFRGIFGQGH
jgi:D-alanyl-D-alanine carboxypeptidase (penicillin-binding protein 5/6)